MQLLVTGGTGFVMSHVVQQWLARGPDFTVISVDVFAPDQTYRDFQGAPASRVRHIEGSVTEWTFWQDGLGDIAPDYFVHGAAMTPNRNRSEQTQARDIVEVNVQGVLNALEWARQCASLQSMVHVSTGSIYGDDGPDGPLPEHGYEERSPDSLYPMTKRAGELLAMRYRELFELPIAIARLSSIYGPMDRWTPGRDFNCIPKIIVDSALRGDVIEVSGVDAVGDWLHAADAASGLLALLESGPGDPAVYNVAHGEAVSIRQLLEAVARVLPDLEWRTSEARQAAVVGNPQKSRGAWGAYDNSRLRALGWTPRPITAAIEDYVAWVRQTDAS